MISFLTGYFLKAYQDRDYVLQEKSKVILAISIILLILVPIIIVMNIVTGQTSAEFIVPLVITMAVIMASIFFLRTGRYSIAAHSILIVTLLAAWSTLYLDEGKDPIQVLDSIVYVPGIMVLLPLVILNKKSAIFLYLAVNMALFGLFVFVAAGRFSLSDVAVIDYIGDNGIAIVFVGLICYQIFKINRKALDRSEEEAKKNQDQYRVIKGLYDSIRDVTGKLTRHSDGLSDDSNSYSLESQSQASAIEEITATTEEVSSGMDMVAGHVMRQNEGLGSLLVNIESLSGSIEDVAKRIQRSRSLADDVSEIANRGSGLLTEMSQSFATVNESSGKMTGIVGMIGDISDKTNLLSLNAAIEAARAGEAGRGFAVVADEISKLADQTASSIKEIDGLIKANVEEIGHGMSNIEATVTTIMQIIQGVSSINMEIDDVSKQMESQREINLKVTGEAGSVASMSDEIKVSIQDQKTAVAEIVKSITGLNEITQVYAEGARKLSEKSRDMDVMVHELDGITKIMDE
jgi:methyl-accepting chemotaxis protein